MIGPKLSILVLITLAASGCHSSSEYSGGVRKINDQVYFVSIMRWFNRDASDEKIHALKEQSAAIIKRELGIRGISVDYVALWNLGDPMRGFYDIYFLAGDKAAVQTLLAMPKSEVSSIVSRTKVTVEYEGRLAPRE